MNTQKNKKIELSPEQANPYLARPEDFPVLSGENAVKELTAFHGQHGDSLQEKSKLLAERKPVGEGSPIGADVNDAASPTWKHSRKKAIGK